MPVGRWVLSTNPVRGRSHVPSGQPGILTTGSEALPASSNQSRREYTDPSLGQERQERAIFSPGEEQSDNPVPSLTKTWTNNPATGDRRPESSVPSPVEVYDDFVPTSATSKAGDAIYKALQTSPVAGQLSNYVTNPFWTQSSFTVPRHIREYPSGSTSHTTEVYQEKSLSTAANVSSEDPVYSSVQTLPNSPFPSLVPTPSLTGLETQMPYQSLNRSQPASPTNAPKQSEDPEAASRNRQLNIPVSSLFQSENHEAASRNTQLDMPVSSPVQSDSGSSIPIRQNPEDVEGGLDAEWTPFMPQSTFSKVSIAKGVEVRERHMKFGVLEAPVDDPYLRRQDLTGIHFRCTTLQVNSKHIHNRYESPIEMHLQCTMQPFLY